MMTTPTPPLFWANEPSVCIVHHFALLGRMSLIGMVNLAMKSTNAYTLIVVLGGT